MDKPDKGMHWCPLAGHAGLVLGSSSRWWLQSSAMQTLAMQTWKPGVKARYLKDGLLGVQVVGQMFE